jgi:hypothetical protein
VSWHEQTTPISNLELNDITCPSTSTCYAVGRGDILGTTNSGTTWNVETAPSDSDPPEEIACASTSTCVIVGNVLNCMLGENTPCPPERYATLSTTDSGRHWIGHGLPPDVSPIGVACTNVFTCYATTYIGQPADFDNYDNPDNGEAGGILKSSNLGGEWSAQTVPTVTGAISAISCPSQTICYAVGQGSGNVGGLVLKASDQ